MEGTISIIRRSGKGGAWYAVSDKSKKTIAQEFADIRRRKTPYYRSIEAEGVAVG